MGRAVKPMYWREVVIHLAGLLSGALLSLFSPLFDRLGTRLADHVAPPSTNLDFRILRHSKDGPLQIYVKNSGEREGVVEKLEVQQGVRVSSGRHDRDVQGLTEIFATPPGARWRAQRSAVLVLGPRDGVPARVAPAEFRVSAFGHGLVLSR